MKAALAAAGLALAAGAVAAQTVYRCGPEGRSYSQQPCAEGRAVQVGDGRSADERSERSAAVQREARLADALERTRREAESREPSKPIALTANRAQDASRGAASRTKKPSKAASSKAKKPALRPSSRSA